MNNLPAFFLAGPIRGGGDWQAAMCQILMDLVFDRGKKCVIYCPCRWNNSHHLSRHFVQLDTESYPNQTLWERACLRRVGLEATQGCVVFWLAEESLSNSHPGPEPYAMDTRGELGEWRARMKFQNARVVVGAEPNFYGLKQIKRNFSDMLGYEFEPYHSLTRTATAAVETAFHGSIEQKVRL